MSQRTVTVFVTRSGAVMSVDAWSLRVPLSSKHTARRANGVRLKKAEERLGRKILVRHSADHA